MGKGKHKMKSADNTHLKSVAADVEEEVHESDDFDMNKSKTPVI